MILYALSYITRPYQKTVNHTITFNADDDAAAQILANTITDAEDNPSDIKLHTIGVESGVERFLSLDYDLTGCAGQIPHVNTAETGFTSHGNLITDESGNVTTAGNFTSEKISLNDSGTDYFGWSAGDSCFKVTSGLDIRGPLYVGSISGSDFTGTTIDATDYIETPIIRNTDGDTLTVQDKLDVTGVITAPGGGSTNWNLAYGWGDHALAGYSTFSGSEGEIAFGNALGGLDGENKLFWDKSNNRLGIGTVLPARTLHIQDDNGVIRIDRDTNSPAFILARFPNNDYTTPWKTFIVGVDATGPDAGTFHISDMHQNVSGSNDKRLSIESDGTVNILGSITVGGTVDGVDIASLSSSVSNVDNTSDADKPISTASQTALDLKATLASPTFSGNVLIGTGTAHDNFHIIDTSPSIILEESDALDSEKVWELTATGGMLKLLAQSDLYTATQTIFEIDRGGTSPTYIAFPNSKFGIGTNIISGKLTVDQSDINGAIPVATLDQADVDEPFIEFLGGTVYNGMTGTNKYLKVKADGGGVYYLRLFD